MSRLNERDIEILSHYAERGNRELYWNYLAQHPGADGYGLLALGVVRNDNMPGATANHFADAQARRDGVRMTERDWNTFGIDLMRRDLQVRVDHFENGRAGQALNLSAADVMRVHDDAFRNAGISPNAWTPREYLQAARREGEREAGPAAGAAERAAAGSREMEGAWDMMLNNVRLGADRGARTLWGTAIAYNDEELRARDYSGRMASAYALAAVDRSNTDPNRIGAQSVYDERRADGRWTTVNDGPTHGPVFLSPSEMYSEHPVRDAARIRELEDTRNLRLHIRDLRDDFHPQDPYRTIARSPRTLAEAEPRETGTRHAALEAAPREPRATEARAADPRAADQRAVDPHGIDLLPPAAREHHAEALTHARRLGLPEEDTHNVAMAMTRRVGDNPTMRSIDDIVAVRGGAEDGGVRVHMMYKPYGDKPPMFNDYVDVNQAAAVPARENAQGMAQSEQQRMALAQAQPQLQLEDRGQQRSGPQFG